jgi:hypothetical protein
MLLHGCWLLLLAAGCGSGGEEVAAGIDSIPTSPPPSPSPSPTPPPTPPAIADPTQLPFAARQDPDKVAYAALGVAGLPAGSSYQDPVTGTRVFKVSSSIVPMDNAGATHEYFEGGPLVSRAWGANQDSYTIVVYLPYESATWLVDFNLSERRFSNWRPAPAPGTELRRAWSYRSTEPQVMYALTDAVLRKFNTAGPRPVELVGGGFPKDLSAHAGEFGVLLWLQSSLSDWFVLMASDQSRLIAYNSGSGRVLVREFSGLDEPKLEHNGRYVWVRHDTGNTIWDLETNSVSAFVADAGIYKGHAGVARGFAFGADGNQATPRLWRVELSRMDPTPEFQGTEGTSHEVNNSGNWVDQGEDQGAWVFHGANTGAAYPGGLYRYAVGIFRLDGSDYRLLCHSYSEGTDYYRDYTWPHATQDGKLVLFKSNMNGSGRMDLFLALVPTRPG